MRPRHLALAAGLAMAAWLAFLGDKTADDGIAEPVLREQVSVSPVARAASESRAAESTVILALQAREALIGGSPRRTPAGRLFGGQSWTPPPPPPSSPTVHPIAPLPAPVAPALPFAYLGKKIENGSWEVYLSRGQQTIIARPQQVIDDIYRVEGIAPPTMTLTYLPLDQKQTLYIGGSD